MQNLKKIMTGLAVATGLAMTAPAALADGYQGAKGGYKAAPVYAPYNWGGLYVGANVGWIDKEFDWAFAPPIAGAVHQAYSLGSSEVTAGLHVGFQHQIGRFVIGVEMAYSPGNNEYARETNFGNNPNLDSEVRMLGLFQIGPRLGFAVTDQLLIYATAGYASASIHSRAVDVVTGVAAFDRSERHDGWYFGGGLEFAMTKHIILGVEYQRVDLGSQLHCASGGTGQCLGAGGGFVDRDIDATADIVRARLSFKLGRDHVESAPLK